MEFRRTLQAIALGLALCLPAVLVRVGLIGEDHPVAGIDHSPASHPAADVRRQDDAAAPVVDGRARLASQDIVTPDRLLAKGSVYAEVSGTDPSRFTEAGDPMSRGGAGGVGGDGNGSTGGGASRQAGSSAVAFAGPAAAAAARAASSPHAAGGDGPAASSAPASTAAPVASTPDPATSDPAPHDQAHRRGVRALDVDATATPATRRNVAPLPTTDAATSMAAAPASSTTGPSTPPAPPAASTTAASSSSRWSANDVAPDAPDAPGAAGAAGAAGNGVMDQARPTQSTLDGVPFVLESSDAPSASGDHPTTDQPFDVLPPLPPAQDPTLVDPRSIATVPEPGTMVLFFLGLLGLSLSRTAAAKKAIGRRRTPAALVDPLPHDVAIAATPSP